MPLITKVVPNITLDSHSVLYNNNNDDQNYGATGYRMLWLAVIAQAFIDLQNNSKKKCYKYLKQRAQAWFNIHNKDFIKVCSMAGVAPDCVIKRKNTITINNSTQNEVKHKKQHRFFH